MNRAAELPTKVKDENRRKQQLIAELTQLRQRAAELEASATDRQRAEEKLRLSHYFLQFANRHTEMPSLLYEFAVEVQRLTGCTAVGVRLLDDEGNIPYLVYKGFSREFYESESSLSLKSDGDMCRRVVRGLVDSSLPLFTPGGSLCVNSTTLFLANSAQLEKQVTCDLCHGFGYESVALVPIRLGERTLGLIHLADPRPNVVTPEQVEMVEVAVMLLGAAIDRLRAEEALREERDRAQKYLDVAGAILVVIDADRKVSLINRKGCDILGFREEEIIGRDWFDNFLPARVKDETRAAFEGLMMGTVTPFEYFENPVLTRSGEERIIAWHNTVLTNDIGDVIGTLSSGADITEQRQLWKKMVEYEELSKLKSNLLSAVSHELRTPLAIIKGYSTMLLDYDRKLRGNEKNEYLRSIDKATDRLTELVDHLLDSLRMEAGLLKLEKHPTNLAKLMEEVAAEARLRAPNHQIVLRLSRRLPTIEADPRRIRQVLDNLIDNAIKYSGPGTRVVISAQRFGQELRVSVTDQGIGIPAADLEKIFERMYRIEERLNPEIGGIGLGLAISRGLVEAHGGRIWAESEPRKGSTFRFTLPARPSQQAGP